MHIFIDFGAIWGVSRVTLWTPFCDLLLLWGAKTGDSFQIHAFDDPEAEMLFMYLVFLGGVCVFFLLISVIVLEAGLNFYDCFRDSLGVPG